MPRETDLTLFQTPDKPNDRYPRIHDNYKSLHKRKKDGLKLYRGSEYTGAKVRTLAWLFFHSNAPIH